MKFSLLCLSLSLSHWVPSFLLLLLPVPLSLSHWVPSLQPAPLSHPSLVTSLPGNFHLGLTVKLPEDSTQFSDTFIRHVVECLGSVVRQTSLPVLQVVVLTSPRSLAPAQTMVRAVLGRTVVEEWLRPGLVRRLPRVRVHWVDLEEAVAGVEGGSQFVEAVRRSGGPGLSDL